VTEFASALAEIRKTVPDPECVAGLHVAIIMDGNGRWATARGQPRTMGHFHGAEAVRRIVAAAPSLGVTHLTLFGFSSENWKRPPAEVQYLMGLLRTYLRRDLAEMHEANVRLSVIGQRAELPADIVSFIEHAENRTRANSGLHLTIALNYGGRNDIVAAARSLVAKVQAGALQPGEIDETLFAEHLSTAFMRDPDLLIRTSGEQRISNFLLWQLAYAEMVFVDKFWPDFDAGDLSAAVTEFRGRDRRFGTIGAEGRPPARLQQG
jgi:undecaprenyl diphosphate synthase